MSRYFSRITRSARGELFNPLVWPFLTATLAYGVGFIVMSITDGAGESTLFASMAEIAEHAPLVWGALAISTIGMGLTFLLFNIPPYGKASGLAGFALWAFAGMCYVLTGEWLPLVAVVVPNMFFWTWQYFSLTKFREQDKADAATMRRYDAGEYDDEENPKDSKIDREGNRGVDRQ